MGICDNTGYIVTLFRAKLDQMAHQAHLVTEEMKVSQEIWEEMEHQVAQDQM